MGAERALSVTADAVPALPKGEAKGATVPVLFKVDNLIILIRCAERHPSGHLPPRGEGMCAIYYNLEKAF